MSVRPNIAAMSGYMPGEQPPAGKFIKLNTNENPYRHSPKVERAIQTALEGGLSRYPDPEATAFRNRAAEVYGVEPDWILCGNGSDDIHTILTRAFVDTGDLVRLPYPSYILYRTLAEIQGSRYEEVRFAEDWSLPDTFVVPKGDLKLAFLPNPNSPSGTVLPPARVLQIAERLPCPLVVDEAYADFAEHNCIELVKRNKRIMVSRTLSKSYGLAGLRFGFLIAQPDVIEQLLKVKDSYNCGVLSIAGATAAIDDQDWLQENCAKVVATRERMSDELGQLGFSVAPSQANFVWCTHAERALQPLYDRLKKNRVLIRYLEYAGWGDGLRIGVGTDEQADACISLLKSI